MARRAGSPARARLVVRPGGGAPAVRPLRHLLARQRAHRVDRQGVVRPLPRHPPAAHARSAGARRDEPRTVRAWYAATESKNSPTARARSYALLRRILNVAVDRGPHAAPPGAERGVSVSGQPPHRIRVPVPRARRRTWTTSPVAVAARRASTPTLTRAAADRASSKAPAAGARRRATSVSSVIAMASTPRRGEDASVHSGDRPCDHTHPDQASRCPPGDEQPDRQGDHSAAHPSRRAGHRAWSAARRRRPDYAGATTATPLARAASASRSS